MNMRKQLAVEKMQIKKNIFAAVADFIPEVSFHFHF